MLRHGFPFHGKTFRVASFRPAHGLNPETVALFERNELTVTRQVRCHPRKGDTVDMVLALNGVPVATCELKNPMTGQTWRDAVYQYRQDRNPDAPLFRFTKRALVHFAADPDEIHMTTRLARKNTRFFLSTGAVPPWWDTVRRSGTRLIRRATAPGISGRRSWNGTASLTSSDRMYS